MTEALSNAPYLISALALFVSPRWFVELRIRDVHIGDDISRRVVNYTAVANAAGQAFRLAVFNTAYGAVDVFRILADTQFAVGPRQLSAHGITTTGIIFVVFATAMALGAVFVLRGFQRMPEEVLVTSRTTAMFFGGRMSAPAALRSVVLFFTLAPMLNRFIIERAI